MDSNSDKTYSKWTHWLDVYMKETQQLYIHRNIFEEVQNIISINPDIQKPSSFYSFLSNTYITSQTITIRRQIKEKSDSISFVKLLSQIAKQPEVLSRIRFVEHYRNSVVKDIADNDFDRLCGVGRLFIDPNIAIVDKQKLKELTENLEAYADKRIAHIDKCQNLKLIPTFKELDECIDYMGELVIKYNKIFHASILIDVMPEYQYDWKEIFLVPWIRNRGIGVIDD